MPDETPDRVVLGKDANGEVVSFEADEILSIRRLCPRPPILSESESSYGKRMDSTMRVETKPSEQRWNMGEVTHAGYQLDQRSRLSWSVYRAGKELGRLRVSVLHQAYEDSAGSLRAKRIAEVEMFTFKPVGAWVHRPSPTAAALDAKFGRLPAWRQRENACAVASGDLLWACQQLEKLNEQKNG